MKRSNTETHKFNYLKVGAPGEMGAPLRDGACRRCAPRCELPTARFVVGSLYCNLLFDKSAVRAPVA